LGISLSDSQVQSFSSYLALLVLWNQTFNLTSLRDPAQIVRLHFLDTLAIAAFLEKSDSIMDIGSGAGFPGLPLAILYPRARVILIEPRRKKANFLRAAGRAIQASQLVIIEDRVERLDPADIGLFSTIAFRAVGRPDFFLRAARPFLHVGGKCLVMHGPGGTKLLDEIQRAQRTLGYSKIQMQSYSLPLGDEKRTLIIVSA
jgi:16S rRNA (guanine527-N7)-methyltransferase